MSLTIENENGTWLDRLLNKWPFCRDTDDVMSFSIAWLFMEFGSWVFTPRLCGKQSLFYNAVFFLRITNPGIFFAFRWSGATDKRALWQTGIGTKLNGRFGILFRFQSDKTSAAGASGPNTGQAKGFEFGTH